MKERKVKASKGVTLALIVSRNFSPRDDSLPRERDKRVRLGHKKGETDLFFFQRSPPRPRHRSFPFIQRSMRGPETRRDFPAAWYL